MAWRPHNKRCQMIKTARSPRVKPLITLLLIGALVTGCSLITRGTRSAAEADGIPAPPPTLTDASPVTAFLQYGDSLQFATATPGVVVVNRVVNGNASELRIRSELRLPQTNHSTYSQGRIIAKYETLRAASAYGAPVGNAYLWVRDTGGGNLVGTLMWRNYATGDTGRVRIAGMRHSSPRVSSGVPDCVDLHPVGDTTRACCLCSDGQYNCPFAVDASDSQLDALLSAAGRARRVP